MAATTRTKKVKARPLHRASTKKYTDEEKKNISSNYRKVKQIFIWATKHHEYLQMGDMFFNEFKVDLSFKCFRKAELALIKINRLVDAYENKPHTLEEIRQDMREMRDLVWRCILRADKCGLTPAQFIDKPYGKLIRGVVK